MVYMWTRAMLKERAKIAFQRNYWKCVLVSFVLILLAGGGGSAAAARGNTNEVNLSENNDIAFNYSYPTEHHAQRFIFEHFGDKIADNLPFPVSFLAIAINIIVIIVFLTLLLNIFVFQPLEVGGCRFYIENAYAPAEPGRLGFAFQKGYYGKIVWTLFCRELFIFLWTFLLIVPGIIKSYEYRMVPYLLADAPDMSRADAFRISKEMMYGEKMNAFVLDLSFFGWNILTACTCGLAGIFYVNPYIHATDAELFLTLRQQYFHQNNQ